MLLKVCENGNRPCPSVQEGIGACISLVPSIIDLFVGRIGTAKILEALEHVFVFIDHVLQQGGDDALLYVGVVRLLSLLMVIESILQAPHHGADVGPLPVEGVGGCPDLFELGFRAGLGSGCCLRISLWCHCLWTWSPHTQLNLYVLNLSRIHLI